MVEYVARKQSKVARDYRLDGNVGSKWYYEVPSHVREIDGKDLWADSQKCWQPLEADGDLQPARNQGPQFQNLKEVLLSAT